MAGRRIALVAFALLLGAAAARAQDPAVAPAAPGADPAAMDPKDPSTWNLPPEVDRPDYMEHKPFLPDLLLRDKREGRYVTGIPAIGWDQEEGLNIGGFAEFYDNGKRDDPYFRSTPYRQKFFVGGITTSENVFRILGRYDAPYFRDSPYRVRVDAFFERGYGAGLRLAWNLSTIISFDFSHSREDSVFYMELGSQF